MRFLVDECTGPAVARWLRGSGHDVFSAYERARGMDDDWVLDLAVRGNRVLITNDKGFGEMIFRERRHHRGVLLLRLEDERSDSKIAVVRRVLDALHECELVGVFVVATESGLRVGRGGQGISPPPSGSSG